MTINDNSTKSINAAIIDLQNQIKQLQHKIGILSKNQLKEDDIEFPGKVEYADEAGKAKEADHAKTADTAKYASETENAVHAGYADIATKATQDASGNVITSTYLPLSGGAMTGDIQYKGSKSTDKMIKFIDNKDDTWGNGVAIGGGGATIIGGGESSDVLRNTLTSGGDELMKIGNDDIVEIWTNLQDGIASGKKFTFGVDGNITTPLGTVALKSELENTFQDHLIGYIRNKPIYRKVILDSTAYNVPNNDIPLIDLGGSNRKFIRSGGYVKYSINGANYRSYTINSKTCAVEIFDQDGLVFLESTNTIVGKNIDIYAWIDYMQS